MYEQLHDQFSVVEDDVLQTLELVNIVLAAKAYIVTTQLRESIQSAQKLIVLCDNFAIMQYKNLLDEELNKNKLSSFCARIDVSFCQAIFSHYCSFNAAC